MSEEELAPEVEQAAEVEEVEVAPFSVFSAMEAGWKFIRDHAGWNATSPDGQHGHGPSPEEAVRNVGAQVVSRLGQRYLVRADGSEELLDKAGA